MLHLLAGSGSQSPLKLRGMSVHEPRRPAGVGKRCANSLVATGLREVFLR